MKSDTRRARMAALIAEGEDDPIFDLLPKDEPEEPQDVINDRESKSRDAEAVLAFLRGEYFTHKQCKNCEGVFLTSYANVGYCKDACRKEALHRMGIDWDSMKPLHERWGNKIPLVIPEDTLHQLYDRLALSLTQVEQNDPELQALVQ